MIRRLLPLLAVAACTLSPALDGTPPHAASTGTFLQRPVFSDAGFAAVVFDGGTVDQLEAAAQAAGASGVWASDARGNPILLVVGGPTSLRAAFMPRSRMASV